MIIESSSTDETQIIAECLSKYCQAGDVLILHGDLGAGKTQFAKGFARGLGIREHVTSPTFTLINEYEGRIPLYHIDAYRLEDPDEALELGLEEYFYGSGVTLIEWPSRIEEFLPENYLSINLEKDYKNDDYRKLILKGKGSRYIKLIEELGQELKANCIF